MELLSVLLFFVITYGLGLLATAMIGDRKWSFEFHAMAGGIGLGTFVTLGVILNAIGVPLYWWVFLIIALAYPAYFLVKNRSYLRMPTFPSSMPRESIHYAILLTMVVLTAAMYIGGAFSYPYLENDDPWEYAVSTAFVADEHTLNPPEWFVFKFLDPYPPGYSIVMGVLHQVTDSMSWTLKFFNGIIIALGLLFFYFFSKLFMNDRNKALFATFVLASLPSFFTHFIWSHTLVIILFFPAMYCLEMIRHDKRWMYPAMIVIASILLTQPSKAAKIGVMLGLYVIIKSVYERAFLKDIFFAQAGGLIISLIWWAPRVSVLLAGRVTKAIYYATQAGVETQTVNWWEKANVLLQHYFTADSGSGSQAYTFWDFFIAKPFGGINVHVGWGIVATVLIVAGILYAIIAHKRTRAKESSWIGVTLAWFVFTFVGVNVVTFGLSFGFFTFRFWLLLAIPAALLAALGFDAIVVLKEKWKLPIPVLVIIVILVAGILLTSASEKYNQNAKTVWPPGASWKTAEEIQLYLQLKTLPPKTMVFSYAGKSQVFGMDARACVWCQAHRSLRSRLLNTTPEELHRELTHIGYKYVVFEVSTIDLYTAQNKTVDEAIVAINENVAGLVQSRLFVPVANVNNGGTIFKVV